MNSTKQKVTLNLSADVVRAYRLAAVRQGVQDGALIEQALREYLGLDALERLQAAFGHRELSEEEANRLAQDAVRETRREHARRPA